jgi:hypothetical protein
MTIVLKGRFVPLKLYVGLVKLNDGMPAQDGDHEVEDEFDLDDDYGVDHYASDEGGDEGGGGGDEAFY